MTAVARRACGWAVAASLAALAPASADAPPSLSSVRIVLDARAAGEVHEAQVTLRSGAQTEPKTVALSAGSAALDLPAGTSWEITITAPNAWAAPQTLLAGAPGSSSEVRIPVWPVARLEGALKLPAGEKTYPAELIATLEPTPLYSQRGAIQRGSSTCSVELDGRFGCAIPAGTIVDVAIRPTGYVPLYRWRLEMKPGERLDLGAVLLVRGASMSGWLTLEEGELEPTKARVRLQPLQMPQGDPVTAKQIQTSSETASVQENGAYQFAAVRPGRYALVAEYPGFALAQVSGIEVFPGAESVLREPLTLRRPLTLEVTLEPPLDGLGRPWQVEIWRNEDLSGQRAAKAVHDGPAAASGQLRVPNVAPGRFSLRVADGEGNRYYSAEDVAVMDAASARIEARIELIRVEGALTLGGEPVAGTLIFGTRFGSLRSAMEADSEGRFTGVLPRAGRWRIEVRVMEPVLEVRAEAVVGEDGGVIVDLPDTRLVGTVVDETGKAVPAASVRISASATLSTQRFTDAEGEFEVRGLPEGRVFAIAEAGTPNERSTSDVETLELKAKTTTGPVALRVRKRGKLSGRVVSALGPVPGAAVHVQPDPQNPLGARASTDLDGRFEVDVDARAREVVLAVAAPGYALKAFEVQAQQATPVELVVSDQGGTVELLVASPDEQAVDDRISPAQALDVLQDGRSLGMSLVTQWTLGHGWPVPQGLSGLRLPAMAPGEYRWCRGGIAERQVAAALVWAETTAICDQGFLLPGGTLTLRLDAGKKDEETP